MRLKSLLPAAMALGIALATSGCLGLLFDRSHDYDRPYTGPGCLIQLFTLPNLQGAMVPVVRDSPELAEPWHEIKSARAVYGTWRLFADRDYKGFMGDYTAPADALFLLPPNHLGSLQCIKKEPEKPAFGYASTPR